MNIPSIIGLGIICWLAAVLLIGWILMLVLGSVGVGWGFWPCAGIGLLTTFVFKST